VGKVICKAVESHTHNWDVKDFNLSDKTKTCVPNGVHNIFEIVMYQLQLHTHTHIIVTSYTIVDT
jgi:hypothetical protein